MTGRSAETNEKVPKNQSPRLETVEGGYLADAFGRMVGSGVRVLALLTLLGLAAFSASKTELFALLSSEPTAAPLLGAVAVAAVLPGALVAAYVWVSDPGDGIPVSVLAVGFFLGTVFTFLAAALNGMAAENLGWLPVYAFPVVFYALVGPIEEGLKILAVSLHPATDGRLNRAIEYAVVGAFVGLGFAFVENAFYIDADVVLAGNTEAIAETAVARASVGPLHVVLTAVAGYYTGKARLGDGYAYGVATAGKGLLAVALLHATYNTMVAQLTTESNLPAQSLGASVVEGQTAAPVFIVCFFVVVLYLLERVVRKSRRSYAAEKE